MKILLTGATGYVGGRLLPRLLERGHDVRCLVRDAAAFEASAPAGARVVEGDAQDEDTLARAFEDVDVAYYLIHSMVSSGDEFEARDVALARGFGAAAARAGVARLVYLGGLGQEDEELSAHLESRQRTGEALREAGVPVTEFRAAVIVGSGSVSFEMIRYLTERVPVLVAPRWAATRCQPIAVGDVLRYLVGCLDVPESAGRVIEVGGRDVLSYGDMMLTYARVRGLNRWLVRVPVLTPRLSSLWVDLVTPVPAAFARPLIEGLSTEAVVHDDAATRLFPEIEPRRYEEAVRLALARLVDNDVETAWHGASQEQTFAVVSGIGGRRGWYYANPLWRLRGALDRLTGGIGMRRGRRDPDRLRVGDALDFWRVEDVREPERVLLRAEMRVPGRAWLELTVEPDGDGSWLQVLAIFEPRGLLGPLYWYALYPAHAFLFSGLVRQIGRRAEARARARPESARPS